MNPSVFPMVLTVVLAHFLALLSPGPDFMLLVKSGVKNDFHNALGLASGIASANAIYILLCILGLGELLAHTLILLRIMKAMGGIFLLYIAASAFKTKKEKYLDPLEDNLSPGGKDRFMTEFVRGFISGISNPKNLVFYLSLFSLVLTTETGQGVKIGLGVWMTCLVFIWDSLILLALSQKTLRQAFSGFVNIIDKAAGVVIGVLGAKLLYSALKEG